MKFQFFFKCAWIWWSHLSMQLLGNPIFLTCTPHGLGNLYIWHNKWSWQGKEMIKLCTLLYLIIPHPIWSRLLEPDYWFSIEIVVAIPSQPRFHYQYTRYNIETNGLATDCYISAICIFYLKDMNYMDFFLLFSL